MKWYLQVLKKYTVFSGRARRKEYWMFVLFQIIFAIAAIVIDNVLGTTVKTNMGYTTVALPYGYIYFAYALATFLPALAVAVRRLHDVNKSGFYYFIVLIPLIGAIWLLVLFCTEGTRGPNNYGEDPKMLEPDVAF